MKWTLHGSANMDLLKFLSVMVTTVCQCSMGVEGLRATELRIIPQTVERSKDVTLICLYNLHSDPLYSVKWYRGQHEFYRYSPTEEPQTKIFPFFGINVDLARSNESQVVLVRVGFLLSGNFSCEVTADAPSFSTSVVSSYLEVIGLPQWPPKMSSEHEQYAPGDVLRANCTAAPARPPASLAFYINDRPIRTSRYQTMPAGAGLHWSHLTLSLQLLPAHYDRGPPLLRCEASIADVYRQSSQMVLYLPNAGPKNERVTSMGISRGPHNDLVIFLTLLYLFPPA